MPVTKNSTEDLYRILRLRDIIPFPLDAVNKRLLIEAMDEWAAIQTKSFEIQLADRDERIKNLEKGLSDTVAMWYKAVNKASDLLNTKKG